MKRLGSKWGIGRNMCFLMFHVVFFASCNGSDGNGNCSVVRCESPPENECIDATTVRIYRENGRCDPATGDCTYESDEEVCENGRCLERDKCMGVTCNNPPANRCETTDTLLVYEAIGTCDSNTGDCYYPFRSLHCDYGCKDRACLDQDLCQGVVCDRPPASVCIDGQTLLEYEPTGRCDPETGHCQYDSSERACSSGCSEGHCLGERRVQGWITILEINTSMFNGPWFWRGGLRAVFMEEPHWTRAHEQQLPDFCSEVVAEGACSLYECVPNIPFWMCNPSCDLHTQECVEQAGEFNCRDLPTHWDAGTLSVEGLLQQVSFMRQENNLYTVKAPPDDLFQKGDILKVEARGGEFPAFVLEVAGTSHLVVDDDFIQLTRGEPAIVSWSPDDPDSRIHVLLESGHHFPHLPEAMISCDVDDTAGQVEVPAVLVDGFLDRSEVITRWSFIIRYKSEATQESSLRVELVVGGAHGLSLGYK